MSRPHYRILYAVASSDWAPWFIVYPFYIHFRNTGPLRWDAEMYFDWRA